MLGNQVPLKEDYKKWYKEGDLCPHCHVGDLNREPTKSGKTSHFISCPKCGITFCTFRFAYHQTNFIEDCLSGRYFHVCGIGGKGSGKTQAGMAAFSMYIMMVPGCTVQMGSTDDETTKRMMEEFERFIPKCALANNSWRSWTQNSVKFKNGSILEVKPYSAKADNMKMRSLSAVYMDELHEAGHKRLRENSDRLRSDITLHYDTIVDPLTGDVKKMGKPLLISSSNAEIGWLDKHVVARAGTIISYDNQPITRNWDDQDRLLCLHMTRTDQNYHLPVDYMRRNMAGHSRESNLRTYFNTLSVGAGQVFPKTSARKIMTSEYDPYDPQWLHAFAVDLGKGEGNNDPLVLNHMLYDPVSDVVIIHDELHYGDFETVEQISKEMKDLFRRYPEARWMFRKPLADKAGANNIVGKKNGGKSWYDLFKEHGIHFKKANLADKYLIKPGLQAIQDRMTNKTFFISENCTFTYEEMYNYKFKEDGGIDKSHGDHHIDCVRYLVTNIKDYNKEGKSVLNPFGDYKDEETRVREILSLDKMVALRPPEFSDKRKSKHRRWERGRF